MIEKGKAGRINRLARPLGVELELVNVSQLVRATPNWHWEHDGTVHDDNGNRGKELVLPPLSGDNYVSEISNVMDYIETYAATVNKTCGFHVHVQSGDLSWMDIRRAILLWCRIEHEVFGTLVDKKRAETPENGHHYCIPLVGTVYKWQFAESSLLAMMRPRLKDESQVYNWLINKLYGLNVKPPKIIANNDGRAEARGKDLATHERIVRQFERIKENKRTPGDVGGHGCRYSAFNLHSHFYRGTIEFRLKEGTLDHEDVLFWPLFCGWLVESVVHFADSEIWREVQGLEDWCKIATFVQPTVIDWVKERIANAAAKG